jgi:UDP-N-acetylglucosamine transferase subunit ALG13
MIFVTVGTQLPFDRMIKVIDGWAGRSGADVFAQIGSGRYIPRHLRWTRTLPADDCNALIRRAHGVAAHAGMGSILTALQHGKPILVMPRRSDLGEHRNDHQLTTARHFQAQGRIRVALDEHDLELGMNELGKLRPGPCIASSASPVLIEALRSFARRVAARASASGISDHGSFLERVNDVAVARVQC